MMMMKMICNCEKFIFKYIFILHNNNNNNNNNNKYIHSICKKR